MKNAVSFEVKSYSCWKMIRLVRVGRVTPAFLFSIFEDRHKYDKDFITTPRPPKPETGMDRVRRMYSKDEFENISPELHTVVQSVMTGSFIGACMGGMARSRDAYLYFIENNQATIFKTTLEAKRKLQDYVTMAFAKGALYWSWRLAFFSGVFGLISTTISVYRGETSIMEYVVAGAITGGLYRCNMGLAATCVGAGLGATLSTVAGLSILLLLKVTGVTMDEIRKALTMVKTAREKQFEEALEKAATIKNDELTRHHEALVHEKGVKPIDQM